MCDYENPWLFKGQPFLSEDIGDSFGFSIGLQTCTTGESTSEESTFGPNESLELQLRTSQGEELQLRVTGRNTTEVVQNLKTILSNTEENLLVERSYLFTGQ